MPSQCKNSQSTVYFVSHVIGYHIIVLSKGVVVDPYYAIATDAPATTVPNVLLNLPEMFCGWINTLLQKRSTSNKTELTRQKSRLIQNCRETEHFG